MSTTIDTVFAKKWESEIAHEFQFKGSILKNTVRSSNIDGFNVSSTTVFGTGEAVTKARHGAIPPMNTGRRSVDVPLEDFYALEYVDKLDQLKVQHDERAALTSVIVNAMQRKIDNIVKTELTTTSNNDGSAAKMTINRILALSATFGDNHAPMDERFLMLSPYAFAALLAFDQFTSSDFVGAEYPLLRKMGARNFLGWTIFPHDNLAKSGNTRTCFAYTKTAVSMKVNKEPSTEIAWISEKQTTAIISSGSCGAKIVHPLGVYKVLVDESVAIGTP